MGCLGEIYSNDYYVREGDSLVAQLYSLMWVRIRSSFASDLVGKLMRSVNLNCEHGRQLVKIPSNDEVSIRVSTICFG